MLFESVFAEEPCKVAEAVAVERRDEEAGRFLIETVRDRGLESELFVIAPLPEHFDEGFAFARSAAGLARYTRGLVYDEKSFRLENDVQIFLDEVPVGKFRSLAPLGLHGRRRFAILCGIIGDAFEIFVNADGVAFAEHLRRFAYYSVYTDFLFADHGEQLGKPFVRERLAQKAVEAHVCTVAVAASGVSGLPRPAASQ